MSVFNYNSLAFTQTNNHALPEEGPRAVPVPLDFSPGGSPDYRLDLQNFMAQAKITMIQSVFIDLKDSDQPLLITVNGSNQKLQAKGRTQGYYQLLAPNPLTLEFHMDNGTTSIVVHLINVPIPGVVWATQ